MACAQVPPAEPRAPEPLFHGLPAAALPKQKLDFGGFICFVAENVAPTSRVKLDVSGKFVIPGDTPVFDPKLTPDTWAEGTCKHLLAEGCVCTVETADSVRTDLETCPGDLSGVMTVSFSAAEAEPEHGLPRTALATLEIQDLVMGSTTFGLVQGVAATTDGFTFTTTRPLTTPDTPLLPERARAPVAPPVPAHHPRPSGFLRGYRSFFWVLKAIGCLTKARC